MNSSYSSKSSQAKQLVQQGIEQILPPKQKRRPLPFLLSLSFFYGTRTHTYWTSTVQQDILYRFLHIKFDAFSVTLKKSFDRAVMVFAVLKTRFPFLFFVVCFVENHMSQGIRFFLSFTSSFTEKLPYFYYTAQ